jgi:hypothetical protein
MQRNMILTEITNLLKIKDDDYFIAGSIKFDSCTNNELHKLLNCILSYKHMDEYVNNAIEIEINELIFEDIVDSCD